MSAPRFSDCPDSAPSPGATVVLHGTTDDCASTTVEVAMNGSAIAHTFDCSGGAFSLSFVVPACEAGKSNRVSVTIKQGGGRDDCDFAVNCP